MKGYQSEDSAGCYRHSLTMKAFVPQESVQKCAKEYTIWSDPFWVWNQPYGMMVEDQTPWPVGHKKTQGNLGKPKHKPGLTVCFPQEIYKPTLCFPSQVRQFVEETARQPTQDSALLTEESTVSMSVHRIQCFTARPLLKPKFHSKWMIFNFQMGSKKVVEPMRPGRTLGRWKCPRPKRLKVSGHETKP